MMPKISQPDTRWVKESPFGVWFLGTETWETHVLTRALDDLEKLMPKTCQTYHTILDIGYGHGQSVRMLDQRFAPERIIGLDIDPQASNKAAAHIAQCQCKVNLIQANANAIALNDASVDMIFCHQTFHHLVDQDNAILEFKRVLKPGGLLLFAESCRKYIHSFIIRLLFRHPMDVQKTDQEYINLIKSAGFIVNEQSISRPFLWWSRTDLGILERLAIQKPAKDREETMVNLVAVKKQNESAFNSTKQ